MTDPRSTPPSETPANARAVAEICERGCSLLHPSIAATLPEAPQPATQRSATAEKALDKLAEVHRHWCNYCCGDAVACLNAPVGGCSLRDYMIALDAPLSEKPALAPVSAIGRSDEIAAEAERAVAKFPTWPTDPLHALAVLGEEFGELTKAMVQLVYEPHKASAEEVRTEAVQTAAMALRLYRSLDRYEYRPGVQHKQAATDKVAKLEGQDG